MAAYLEEAQTRNFQKWSVLGTYLWPNNYVGATYAEEIAYLKTWITDRAAWLDANMFGTCDDLAVDENAYSRLRVFPNPSDGVVNIEFPTEVSNAQVMLYDATGRVLVTQHLSNTYATKLDVSTLPAGMYTYKVIEDTNHTTTGKLSVN